MSVHPLLPRRALRLAALRALVRERGAVHLAEAAAALEVSAMTLRRDLASAEAGDLVLLGGHVTALAAERPYQLEREAAAHLTAKKRAARHAARLVRPGDTVFVDCGTTLPHLITALPPALPLTLVCYALNIASLAARRPEIRLILLGGVFHPSSATFDAAKDARELGALGITIGFFSAGGIDAERGASCFNPHEVPVKQAALAASRRRYLVADHSKVGRPAPAPFAALSAFDALICDAPPPAGMRLDVPLDLAPAEE
jgi:DeoR family deoxyribose operon repressor